MRMTSAQRYNEKMHRIFEEAKANNMKYAPYHMFQMLTRLTEKVERTNNIQRSGGRVTEEDWLELDMLTNEAKQILERAKEAKLAGMELGWKNHDD